MKTILIVTFAVILVAGVALLGWYVHVRERYRKVMAEKYHAIAPLMGKLARREMISKTEVEAIAHNSALRYATYRALEAYGRTDLFPPDLLTVEHAAESFLVTWLEFPTEMGEVPKEIHLYATVALDGEADLTYYVFKYRMQPEHWAAHYNWMLGVVGPYNPRSQPYDVPAKIFSRFSTLEATTAGEEVRWVHDHIPEAKNKDHRT